MLEIIFASFGLYFSLAVVHHILWIRNKTINQRYGYTCEIEKICNMHSMRFFNGDISYLELWFTFVLYYKKFILKLLHGKLTKFEKFLVKTDILFYPLCFVLYLIFAPVAYIGKFIISRQNKRKLA